MFAEARVLCVELYTSQDTQSARTLAIESLDVRILTHCLLDTKSTRYLQHDGVVLCPSSSFFSETAFLQAHQRKYLAACEELVKRASPNLQMHLVIQMRVIGLSCPDILGEHRKLFEELRENAALKDFCLAALDVIEGRRYTQYH